MEWISVKTKQPETRQRVLFSVSPHYAGGVYAGKFVAHYENETANFGAMFISDDNGFFKIDNVTHWMPMPEMPVS